MKTVVVGCGSWGTAFAQVLREREHEVVLACRDAAQARIVNETHRNPKYLPKADLRGIEAAALEDAPVAGADLVVVAVPSAVFRDVVTALPGKAPLLNLTKGLDPATGERLSTTVRDRPVAVLSGPNIADEISEGLPAAAVIASDEPDLARDLQRAINSVRFRVYVNDDMLGVELCAASKNVIALAAGAVDGLGLGDNGKAGIITRGLAEMRRLADAAGANPDTFAGLAGMGDLIVTCFSPRGRNRRAGELIARGATPDEARQQIGQVVEGLTTAPILHALSQRCGVEMPITAGVCSVLGGTTLTDLLGELMRREPTSE